MAERIRTRYAVHFFVEGAGFVVRGTLDPHEALALAVADEFEYHFDAADFCRRDNGYPGMPDADDVRALADLCHELLQTARPGMYRMNPASVEDRENFSWWISYVDRPGRGVWQGVRFYA